MPRYQLGTRHFGDDGFLTHPMADGVPVKKTRIKDPKGINHEIEGFDYASHLLGDAIVCTCGEQIDAHQIALYTKGREHIIVPARCCNKFRWFEGEDL